MMLPVEAVGRGRPHPVVACWEMDRWLEHLRHDDLALLERATGRRAGPGQVEALLADPAAYQAVSFPTATRSCGPRRS
jgi:hypothetical protein